MIEENLTHISEHNSRNNERLPQGESFSLEELSLSEEEILAIATTIDSSKPEGFARREQAPLVDELLSDEASSEFIPLTVQFLRHKDLHKLVEDGKVTLGMIKPRAFEAKNIPEDADDDTAAETVMDEVEGVMLAVPIKMTEDEAEAFYGLTLEGLRENGREEIAKTIVDFMSSGTSTIFLKYDESGNAFQNWRNQMGPTREEEFLKPDYEHTLRGKYAKYTENNIVHGSDSVESAHREINILADFLESRRLAKVK